MSFPTVAQVYEKFPLPYMLYDTQAGVVEQLNWRTRAGYYMWVGTGKTPVSVVACLAKILRGDVKHVICVMPPILITGWARFLSKIPGVTWVEYRGAPAKRKAINLDDPMFILVSYQIFKRDWDYLFGHFRVGDVAILCDEAQAIKNVGSDNYKKVRDFAVGNHLLLLTGTPLSTPYDSYAYIKLVAPEIYRSLAQFENIHVKERDFFDKPSEWQNLDLLKENLSVNAVRILKEDMVKDMPPVTYQELWYELDPKHQALYNRILDEQLVKFDNGEKLDLTNASALFFAMQQVPLNAEYFSQGAISSTGFEMVDEVMDELGDKKLVVFTYYRRTSEAFQARYGDHGVQLVYGGMSNKAQQRSLDTFISDPKCRMLVMNIQAGGAGIDGLQHVCSDMLFAEMPFVPPHFVQAVARLDRTGQHLPVNVRLLLAEKTLQKQLWLNLQEKDSLVNLCIRGQKDLKDALRGL